MSNKYTIKKYKKTIHKGDDIVEALAHDNLQPKKTSVFPKLRFVKKAVQKSISEIETAMGFNNVSPISLSASDADEFSKNPDDYTAWYEEELRNLYEQSTK